MYPILQDLKWSTEKYTRTFTERLLVFPLLQSAQIIGKNGVKCQLWQTSQSLEFVLQLWLRFNGSFIWNDSCLPKTEWKELLSGWFNFLVCFLSVTRFPKYVTQKLFVLRALGAASHLVVAVRLYDMLLGVLEGCSCTLGKGYILIQNPLLAWYCAPFSCGRNPRPASQAGCQLPLESASVVFVSRISGGSWSQYFLGKKLQLTNVVTAQWFTLRKPSREL